MPPPLALLESTLQDETGPLGQGFEVFRPGYDQALDEQRRLACNSKDTISQYEASLRSSTGISSLKIKNHKTFGLIIEVTKTHLKKVPPTFIRRQTMVNCERFTTMELQDFDQALASAQDKAIQREAILYDKLLVELSHHKREYHLICNQIALLDLLAAFAFKARESSYIRPTLSSDGGLYLTGSRHPVIESFVGKRDFVPNDIAIPPTTKNILITGPNMAGKSTIMRQVAIMAILHQVGSFVPTNSGIMPIFDRVFTRVGAFDDISGGQSTFMVEMAEAARILREAGPKSLVILDEVGRGTSTKDGMALASAILEELAGAICCYSLFATHYHEIVPFAAKLKGIRTMRTEVLENNDGIVFTHRLIDGAASTSYGIEVASLAGVPQKVVAKAKRYLKDWESNRKDTSPPTAPPLESQGFHTVGSPQQHLETAALEYLDKIGTRLLKLKIHKTTPLQALNILNELKVLYDRRGSRQSNLFDD